MEYTLIYKYLDGKASDEEVEMVFNWIEASPENKTEFIQYKKAWALTAKSNKNEVIAWGKVQNRISGKGNVRSLYQNVLRYAAAGIILLGLGMVLQNIISGGRQQDLTYLAQAEITAPWGQMTNVKLPDGTMVMLNSGSSILYNGHFAEGERTVELEGEAYFDVVKDTEHPFTVKTNVLDVRVYGTSFNIEAYPDDNHVNTTLIEGSLGVANKTGKELALLVPGENARFYKTESKMIVEKVKTDVYKSWKEGVITFRSIMLKDLAKKIERWYNVEIVIRNKKLLDEPYWGTILKNKPIDQILEVLNLTAEIEYKIIPRADQPSLIYWD